MAEQLPGTYSGENIVNAVQNQIPTYNYQDPYGARQQIEQRLGFGEATQAEQQAQQSLLGFQDTTRAQINALRANRDLSTGLEAGFEAQRTREASQQEQVLTNQLNLAQQKRMALEGKIGQEYDVYQRERANREAAMLEAMQYGADVNIGMGLEDIVKKGVEARKQQEKEMEKKLKKEAEEAKKDAYKQSLKDQLIAMGSSVKGLSKNELERKLEKKNKEALKQAERMAELEYQSKLKSLSGGGAEPKTNYTDVEQRIIAQELIQEAESKGLYGGYAYEYAEQEADRLGIGAKENNAFNNALRGVFGIAPLEQNNRSAF